MTDQDLNEGVITCHLLHKDKTHKDIDLRWWTPLTDISTIGFQIYCPSIGGLYHAPLFHMEYVLAEISPILVIFFHLYST